jgi:mRNA-degrading endonuclease RelE of RelBE toxin-antitoxin system
MYEVRITDSALDDLRHLRKGDQVTILQVIAQQLVTEPLSPTRNRKPLRPNELSQWEPRIDRFRAFYDVDDGSKVVFVKAVGWKDHNTLYIRGQEYTL